MNEHNSNVRLNYLREISFRYKNSTPSLDSRVLYDNRYMYSFKWHGHHYVQEVPVQYLHSVGSRERLGGSAPVIVSAIIIRYAIGYSTYSLQSYNRLLKSGTIFKEGLRAGLTCTSTDRLRLRQQSLMHKLYIFTQYTLKNQSR